MPADATCTPAVCKALPACWRLVVLPGVPAPVLACDCVPALPWLVLAVVWPDEPLLVGVDGEDVTPALPPVDDVVGLGI